MRLPERRSVQAKVIVAVIALVAASSLIFRWGLIAELVTSAITLIGLYVTLADRPGGADSASLSFDQQVDKFAEAVRTEWDDELKERDLDESLPISWETVPVDMGDDEGTASPAQPAGRNARKFVPTVKMKDVGKILGDVLEEAPNHRLVVLGAPGSGKTVLLIKLLLHLVKNRTASDPVPVLFQLSSWRLAPWRRGEEKGNRRAQSFQAWLLSQLEIHYRDFSGKVPGTPQTLFKKLITSNRLLPILDGLDELDEDLQAIAISRINAFLGEDTGIVIASRKYDYYKAINGPDGGHVHLKGAIAISLRDLDGEAVVNFIEESVGRSPRALEKWQEVFAALRAPDDELGKALRTPLMAGLARAVYNPVPGAGSARKPLLPSELVSLRKTPELIKPHLLSAYVPVVYQPPQDETKESWGEDQAEKWLKYLARHLQEKRRKTNLAWWELHYALPASFAPVVVGLVCAVAAGLAVGLGTHVGHGIGIGLGTGMILALAIGVPVRLRAKVSERKPGWGIAGGLIGAVLGALGGGLAGKFGIGHALWPFGGLTVSLGVGLGAGGSTTFRGGLPGGLVGGFVAAVLEQFGVGLPAGIVNGIGTGLCVGLAVHFVGRRIPASRREWNAGAGLAAGLAIGAAVGLVASKAVGVRAGLVMGAAVGAAAAWPCGLTPWVPSERRRDGEIPVPVSPREALAEDYRAFWVGGLAAGLAAAAAGFCGGGLVSVLALKIHHPHLGALVSNGLAIGLASGIVVGVTVGFYHAASGSFMLTRAWLALRGNLPWRLMNFLDDAHRRRVLRQAGGYYQFMHKELQEELAAPSDSEISSAPMTSQAQNKAAVSTSP